MKSLIKKLIPTFILIQYWRFKRFIERKHNMTKETEDVFTNIYKKNKWGGARGDFFSGDGSLDEQAVSAYINVISERASKEGYRHGSFVDLGCGDYRIGKKLTPLCSHYTGVDIVKPLIHNHQAKYGSKNVKFIHLNIVQDNLPDGDVCFIRQVFQHLSNDQIKAILPKLNKYKWVFITEHYPTENSHIKPNVDKVHGSDVRVCENSGVYLTDPPFNLPKDSLEQVLEVPGVGVDERIDRGVIRTFLYKPGMIHLNS